MFSLNMILDDCNHCMSEHRYNHTLGVVETAQKLAVYYGIDSYKAKMAAALHDCSRTADITEEQMQKLALRTAFTDEYPSQTNGVALLHALASEVLAREKYGITDMEILSAVRWHTTGRKNMTDIEMIVYSADMIEPQRHFEGVEGLRVFMYMGLERLTFECLKHTVMYLQDCKQKIHQCTLDAYEYLKKNA